MGTGTDIMGGAATGASIGSVFGPWGTVAGGIIGGAAGGFLGDKGKPTKRQNQQQELIDQLLASLKGDGAYSDLFNMDDNAFQKSYVEPAKAMFKNQIAPQIEQQYIASGQQRGTGMEDSLSRAGVEMDQLLNQQYAQMQQAAQERKLNTMNYILGSGAGQKPALTTGQAVGQGITGYIQSEGFRTDLGKAGTATTDYFKNRQLEKERKGFEPGVLV
jgi:hypothetical protein